MPYISSIFHMPLGLHLQCKSNSEKSWWTSQLPDGLINYYF